MLKLDGVFCNPCIFEHIVYSHQQMNGNITNLEMEESTNTVNEMERAISDLRAENLKLKLDLGGERNDDESASIDESLLSVDEEVQEVTAVRLVVKIQNTQIMKNQIHDFFL